MIIRNKIITIVFITIFLNSCVQSTAMIAPTMTLVSTGNVYHAGASYGANKAVEKETGVPTTKYIIDKIENRKIKKKNNLEIDLYESLSILLELNIEKTKKIIN